MSHDSAGGPLIATDAAGGVFVAWVEIQAFDADVYMQRVTAAGSIGPGWPPGGLRVTLVIDSQDPTDMASDGSGGALIVWGDFRNSGVGGTAQDVYAQRILADGSIAPGWPVSGAPVSRAPDYQSSPLIASDGVGGAYITWDDERDFATRNTDVYAQHLTAGGTVAAGWPENGLPVCTDPAGQFPWGIVPDDSGGVVVVWGDSRNGVFTTYAQRLRADGTIAPGWAENGVLVSTHATRGGAVRDGAGGFYAGAASLDPVYYDDAEYYVQRFTFAGTRAPGWPDGGLKVCGAPRTRTGLRIAEDGAGGALLAWSDERPTASGIEVYAARVLPDALLAPGWVVDGTLVSSPSGAAFDDEPDLVPDGVGGAYVVWLEEVTPATSFVQHLTARGAVAPGWPAYGVRVSTQGSQFDSRIASDGAGGAIVAWDDPSTGRLGIWAQRFVTDGVVAAQVALVSAVAEPDRVLMVWHVADALSFRGTVERRSATSDWQPLGEASADGTGRIEYEDRPVAPGERYAYRLAYLEEGTERRTTETWVEVPRALALALEGFRPNPAVREITAAFTLPSAARATLELLDLAGRRVAAREVGSLGAGRHALRLDQGQRLVPGVYWLRLTQDDRSLLARGAVVR